MTVVTPTIYAIRSSIEGNMLGLDSTQAAASAGGVTIGDHMPYLMGRDFRGLRLFKPGSTGLQGNDYKIGAPSIHCDLFDDFIGKAINTFTWNVLTGSDGTNSPIVNVQNGGVVRLTMGGGSTHTMAVNGSQFTGARNWFIANGGVRMESKVKVSATASLSLFVGLTDAVTLQAPFTRTTVTTTANATNAVGFLQDAASTDTKMYAVSVNAGGTAQSTALSIDFPTAAFSTYRVEVDALGNAYFFVDGVLVATQLLAVATTSQLTPSVGGFNEATGSPQTVDVDYVMCQQVRA